jgi:integrase
MIRLFDCAGRRKYLTLAERPEFLRAAEKAPGTVRTFFSTLVFTGCRISEALALTATRVDVAASVLVFESLEKRRNESTAPSQSRGIFLKGWRPCMTSGGWAIRVSGTGQERPDGGEQRKSWKPPL